MRRAARWDGAFPLKLSEDGRFTAMSPLDVREVCDYVAQQRGGSLEGFDVAVGGATPADDPARAAQIVVPYAQAGLTWWVEGLDWFSYRDPSAIAERIEAGPPRLS
jgi:hypothetical protein